MRIILVHGAWSDGRTWEAVAPLLTAAGHDVTAVTLPGHGADGKAPGEVGMADYAAHVAGIAAEGAPALLVGHSMGGMVISAAADLAPEAVRKLVYVAALLPRSGQSLLDLIKTQQTRGVADAVRPADQPGATVLVPEQAADALFQDATPEQRAQAMTRFVPQPNKGQTDRVDLTEARFGSLPRAYVFCTEDRTVTYPLQQAMEAASPCAERFTLDCGHLPQLTRPAALSEILAAL
ncbi:alpha/beta fold hydrolase [Acidimangrovimonas pyrenivorans]|uniref:Alpha/beta fold hydrolase n=1 Tax=Acidimangrovimonas pyrenivorans TaxID=2030798 RepID=A0ABV7AN24_9RHOB